MDIQYIKKNIYVLDMKCLENICKKLNVDCKIYLETNDGIKKINESLHKEFIINKIFNVLEGGKDAKIIYSKNIQNYDPTDKLTPSDFVCYGQYKTTDKNVKKLLIGLTDGKFKFGAISQKIIKKYWLKNKKITYKKFAHLWMIEFNKGEIAFEELAYNNFMKQYGDKQKWTKMKLDITNKFKNMKLLRNFCFFEYSISYIFNINNFSF